MSFPMQQSGMPSLGSTSSPFGRFDMRDKLTPRRLTMVMWDNAYLMRHIPGGSFENFDLVLDQAIERGYNTLRLDPMPQWLDLARPEKVLHWPEPNLPFMPWNQNTEVKAPVGQWLIEFMEKLLARRPALNYTLSAWWFWNDPNGTYPKCPPMLHRPKTNLQAAEVWAGFLEQWKKRFGLDGLVYLDVANEIPYFLPEFIKTFTEATGAGWGVQPRFTDAQIAFLSQDINDAMKLLQRAFPEVRFTGSIHGDVRWLDVPLNFDCLDVHFYADADPRWVARTKFETYMSRLMTSNDFHAEFSSDCMKAHRAAAPMFRARQRAKLSAFSAWANQQGMPLTTTESWSSWYYYDSPNLDWSWLLEWAEWSVEDAIEHGMWGWTPHNYCQPQFKNWQDVRWHRRLTDRFLQS